MRIRQGAACNNPWFCAIGRRHRACHRRGPAGWSSRRCSRELTRLDRRDWGCSFDSLQKHQPFVLRDRYIACRSLFCPGKPFQNVQVPFTIDEKIFSSFILPSLENTYQFLFNLAIRYIANLGLLWEVLYSTFCEPFLPAKGALRLGHLFESIDLDPCWIPQDAVFRQADPCAFWPD